MLGKILVGTAAVLLLSGHLGDAAPTLPQLPDLPALTGPAAVSCTKHLGRASGSITCTSRGGRFVFADVFADCARQRDQHDGRWTVDGTATLKFACRAKMINIYAVL
jgi:hypothetical protein